MGIELAKRKISGKEMIIWEGFSECRDSACPVYGRCGGNAEGFCKIEKGYIDNFLSVVRRGLGEKITELALYRVGIHLAPLYRQLCKLKIEEMGLTNVVYTTDKGSVCVHPLYREIRSVISSIENIWRNLGLDITDLFDPFSPSNDEEGVTKNNFGGDEEKGDPSYYERMRSGKNVK